MTAEPALLSRPQASAKGLSVAGVEPAEFRTFELHSGRLVRYPVYREAELKPKRAVLRKAACSVDLLLATFTVNRTAKRYRDKAQTHYQSRQHGFAGDSRKRKEALYKLKDRGIVAAVRLGMITATGTHGPLTYYEGGGFRFHSLLCPEGAELQVLGDDTILVEAKPKGKRECRLADAQCTLEALPDDTAGFRRHAFAPRKRERDDEDW